MSSSIVSSAYLCVGEVAFFKSQQVDFPQNKCGGVFLCLFSFCCCCSFVGLGFFCVCVFGFVVLVFFSKQELITIASFPFSAL